MPLLLWPLLATGFHGPAGGKHAALEKFDDFIHYLTVTQHVKSGQYDVRTVLSSGGVADGGEHHAGGPHGPRRPAAHVRGDGKEAGLRPSALVGIRHHV